MPSGVYDHSVLEKADWDNVPLGEKSDSDLARELKVNIRTIFRHRKKRGIPRYKPNIIRDHIPNEDLEKLSASECSRAHDIAVRHITRARKERNIEKESNIKGIDWDKQPLGEKSDAEIARELGVNNGCVTAARRFRRIPAFTGTNPNDPKGIDWDKQPLGLVSDAVLARKCGVNQSVVYKARKRRNIPPFVPWMGKGINWDEVDFSQPEEKIARTLGVSQSTVSAAKFYRRHKMKSR